MTTQESEGLFATALFGGLLAMWVLYLVPSIIAFRRRHPDRWLIAVTNLLLGATGVGWVAALTWALRLELPSDTHQPKLAYDEGASDIRTIASGPWDTAHDAHPNAGASSRPGTAIAEIERLSRLRTAGHLSEVEFAELKQSILRRM